MGGLAGFPFVGRTGCVGHYPRIVRAAFRVTQGRARSWGARAAPVRPVRPRIIRVTFRVTLPSVRLSDRPSARLSILPSARPVPARTLPPGARRLCTTWRTTGACSSSAQGERARAAGRERGRDDKACSARVSPNGLQRGVAGRHRSYTCVHAHARTSGGSDSPLCTLRARWGYIGNMLGTRSSGM